MSLILTGFTNIFMRQIRVLLEEDGGGGEGRYYIYNDGGGDGHLVFCVLKCLLI